VPMPLSDIAEFARYRLVIFYYIKSHSKLTVKVIAARDSQSLWSSLLFFLMQVTRPSYMLKYDWFGVKLKETFNIYSIFPLNLKVYLMYWQ